MKKSSDNIGNRTHDLPAYSAVPQPTAPPRHNEVSCQHSRTACIGHLHSDMLYARGHYWARSRELFCTTQIEECTVGMGYLFIFLHISCQFWNGQFCNIPILGINLTFRGPCIVLCSYNKTNEMHYSLKFIFGIEFYMFRTVSLYIIRSLALYTQQQVYVIQVVLTACQHNLFDIYLFLFLNLIFMDPCIVV